MNNSIAPRPTELRLKPGGTDLQVTFDTGEMFSMTAEYLRVESPSAEVKGHGPGQEKTVPGKRNVVITKIEPVGNYAVRLTFDDMHNTGIYSWETLHKLGSQQDEIWQQYLNKLNAEGLDRG